MDLMAFYSTVTAGKSPFGGFGFLLGLQGEKKNAPPASCIHNVIRPHDTKDLLRNKEVSYPFYSVLESCGHSLM